VLARYGFDPAGATWEEVRSGHINRTWFVHDPHSGRRQVLQWLNPRVFPCPLAVMRNVAKVTRHLHRAQRSRGEGDASRPCLELVPTVDGQLWVDTSSGLGALGAHLDSNLDANRSGVYRLFERIPDAVTLEQAPSARTVHAAAGAFGRFQALLVELDPAQLEPALERFHDTPWRFEQLRSAVDANPHRRVDAAAGHLDGILALEYLAPRLTASGLPRRVVHNDAKLSNVLFDRASLEPLCVIDLDTVMPGFAAYDFGDMVRSMSHQQAEDADPELVRVDPDLFAAIADGFLRATRQYLDRDEIESLFDGAVTLVLQQGVRFLTDFLLGDVYFRVHHPLQNLARARAHLALAHDLLQRERALREILARCAGAPGG
jgi:hypothetical protein